MQLPFISRLQEHLKGLSLRQTSTALETPKINRSLKKHSDLWSRCPQSTGRGVSSKLLRGRQALVKWKWSESRGAESCTKEVKVHSSTITDGVSRHSGAVVEWTRPLNEPKSSRGWTRSTGSWSSVDEDSANLLMVPLAHGYSEFSVHVCAGRSPCCSALRVASGFSLSGSWLTAQRRGIQSILSRAFDRFWNFRSLLRFESLRMLLAGSGAVLDSFLAGLGGVEVFW